MSFFKPEVEFMTSFYKPEVRLYPNRGYITTNVRLNNSYIYTRIRLFAPKITKTRTLERYFPIIVNSCAYPGHKNRQKDDNSMFVIDIHPGLHFGPH